MVDVFEEMPVDLLVDRVDHAVGMQGQRDFGRRQVGRSPAHGQ